MNRPRFAVAASIVLAAIPLFAPIACSPGEGGPGAAGPDIRVVDLAGIEAALEAHRGKGVLLNFWAIWCVPCVAELPELVETAHEFRDEGGVVLGVSYDLMVPGVTREGVLEKMRAFVRERDVDIPVLVYEADDYDAINERFELPGQVPVTLAIDREGNIVDRQENQAGKERFAAMMRKALGG
jgi:thiol-disulfide isomerase/thioredoxin